ncbi:halocyanin domain-containing protein [Natronosalvus rutilus]|uniref:Halocyanin domain-containing protein n=1 Tax=Natronosalvus rutilus TaxID=2953753 RepID=A0A9E7N884_9EURY|nr:halocyanin domain-containing protein [Natronosalvus rutilus]UTF52208.1 halocyanin domain-containing protein [Natronosalvus rutilus]
MTVHDKRKRRFLRAVGGALVFGGLAGCLEDEEASGGNGDSDGSENGGNSNGNGNGGADYDFDGYLDDANNYDGVEDHTGESEVTVDVGAGSDGFAYGPAAIVVDSGTTVVWEWTGAGSPHDVIAEDGSFESEMLSDEGETFEHTFEETGTFTYHCSPHVSMGMKGAVVVE